MNILIFIGVLTIPVSLAIVVAWGAIELFGHFLPETIDR